jgi:hypothetical protein
MDRSRNYEPGVIAADGAPEVSAVFDPTNGGYYVKQQRLTPFCTGQSHLADGRVLAAGGDDHAGDRCGQGASHGAILCLSHTTSTAVFELIRQVRESLHCTVYEF